MIQPRHAETPSADEVPQDLSFLPAALTDLPKIQRLAREIWPQVYSSILSRAQICYMLDRMYATEIMEGEVQTGIQYELASADCQVVGFLAYGDHQDSADLWLHKLYLHPSVHGRGFGQQAIRHVIRIAGQSEHSGIRLRVNRQNLRAIRAYQRAGLNSIREICTDFGSGFVMDDYEMRMQIPSVPPPPPTPS